MSDIPEEHPHPADTTAAETRTMWRRLGLGLAIGVSLYCLQLVGSAAMANYLGRLLHPFFFQKKVIYIRMDVSPSPSATSPAPKH